MARSYRSAGSRRDVQVLSQSQVLDVEVVYATTVPDGVYFEIPVPLLSWQTVGADAFLEPVAEGIQATLANPHVTGGYWAQDVDDNGLLADFVWFTVSVSPPPPQPGPFTTQVQVPVGYLGADPAIRNAVVTPMIDDAVSQLEATVAL